MTPQVCPSCREPVANGAVKCPHCQSDIERKTDRQIHWAQVETWAKNIRDWIGLPAAMLAVFTAFFNPAVATIYGWVGWDGADLTAVLYDSNFINVGYDDKPTAEQVDKITMHIPFIPGVLSNDGLSTASVVDGFRCTLNKDQEANEPPLTYRFGYFDPNSQKRAYLQIGTGASIPFYSRLLDAGTEVNGWAPTARVDTCEFTYADKYGTHAPHVLHLADNLVSQIRQLVVPDELEGRQGLFCKSMLTNMILDDKTVADCVSNTHAIAIEPAYLWKRGVARSLQFSASFAKIAGVQNQRAPGVILACESGEEGCTGLLEEMKASLGEFRPALTVWICDPRRPLEQTSLDRCRKTEFPSPP
ncbi:hypothetical protein N2597_22515 (plasmid) [Rhizobium sophoriradicis]|uniref:hypothetical protein n=1 Tax=Rhizobium sophoriradicis TaxID=1535245 RepID=UPI00161DEF3B|nr:hypothetical protein N2597_22515 [Rhizobium leguminosarum bv. phaseoli]